MDITMCKGIGCELKDICFRSKAEAGTYQSWFMTSPNNGLECEYFLEYCNSCNQINGVHKMSCPTQKIQINL